MVSTWMHQLFKYSKYKDFSLTPGSLAGLSTSGSLVSETSTPPSSHSSPPSSSVTGWPLSLTLRTWSTTFSLPTIELILSEQQDWQSLCKLWAERLINILKYSYIQNLIFSLIFYIISTYLIVLSKNPVIIFRNKYYKIWRWWKKSSSYFSYFVSDLNFQFPLCIEIER